MGRDLDPPVNKPIHLEGKSVFPGDCIQFNTHWSRLVSVPWPGTSLSCRVSVKFEQFYVYLGVLGPQVCQSKHIRLLGIFLSTLREHSEKSMGCN